MKYSNQINMFLAIAGCVVVLWVFSQTYLQPSPDARLDITDVADITGADLPSTQAPAAYEADTTTIPGSVSYGTGSRRTSPGNSYQGRGAAAGGGSLQSGSGSTGRTVGSGSTGSSVSRALQSTGQGDSEPREAPDGPDSEVPASSRTTGADRPANVGGFNLPPAGQAQGMEQAKRTPSDSTSERKYVPFRSSMANRPN